MRVVIIYNNITQIKVWSSKNTPRKNLFPQKVTVNKTIYLVPQRKQSQPPLWSVWTVAGLPPSCLTPLSLFLENLFSISIQKCRQFAGSGLL